MVEFRIKSVLRLIRGKQCTCSGKLQPGFNGILKINPRPRQRFCISQGGVIIMYGRSKKTG